MPSRTSVAQRQGIGFLLWRSHTHHCKVSNTDSRVSAKLSRVDQPHANASCRGCQQ
ncbi:hypothetical protein PDJAM_G00100320, partial [Pangasius djambal]|nr:hypothetical protein [Pangasius djambal]